MSERIIDDGYFRYVETDVLGRRRQFLRTQDSVGILVYITDLDSIVLVQQPREAMIRPDNSTGDIVELIAGRFDRELGLIPLIIKEAAEEADITVRPEQVEVLNQSRPMAVSAGGLTERAYLCYAEVTADQVGPDQNIFSAAGEDERIKRLIIPVAELDDLICEDVRVLTMILYFRLQQVAKKGLSS